MKQYVVLIIFSFILAFIAEWIKSSKNDVAVKLRSFRIQYIFIVILLALIVYYSAERSIEFGDTGSYWSIFKENIQVSKFKDCWEPLKDNKNGAFYVLSSFIKLYITQDKTLYFGIIAFLINLMALIFLYKYSKLFEFAVLIYFLSAQFNFTLNGLKQSLAVMLIALSVWMIEKKKWYIYFPFLYFFVMQFHRSSMIFFLIYIIVNIDIKSRPEIKKNMPYFILVLGVILLVTSPLTKGYMANLAEDTNYGEYSNTISSGNIGSNPIRIFISIVPFALGMAFRKYIEPHEKYYHIFMCMTAFSTVFYMLGLIFVFYARFALYFNMFTIPLMTWVVYYAPKKKRKLLFAFLVLFYLLYFYLEMVVSLGFTWDSNIFYVYTLRDLLAK